MTEKEILARVDHTVLAQDATDDMIREVCDDGIFYHTASVCIPPSFVKFAKNYVGDKIKICTVIGFPNGYSTSAVKCTEAADAVSNGADEIDMVINIGWAKEHKWQDLLTEINMVKKACSGRLLKVIIETCLLSDEEKIMLCRIINESDADYIKTSTGFSKGGAAFDDIALFKKYITGKKIKAAGGIKSFVDAEKFIELGADRLGTSRLVKILKEGEICVDFG